jgi:hypothetical protein
MDKGPIDLSGLDDDLLKKALSETESIYKKFHHSQTLQIARAAKKACNNLIENVKNEISQIKNKYLT